MLNQVALEGDRAAILLSAGVSLVRRVFFTGFGQVLLAVRTGEELDGSLASNGVDRGFVCADE